jgi:hypothetical protein
MQEYDEQQEQSAGKPTAEAEALHGAQAEPEQYPQPEAVVLDGGTRIATDGSAGGDEDDDTDE